MKMKVMDKARKDQVKMIIIKTKTTRNNSSASKKESRTGAFSRKTKRSQKKRMKT